jgi:hypothetical protein
LLERLGITEDEARLLLGWKLDYLNRLSS